jgi:SulP family sulfate permease
VPGIRGPGTARIRVGGALTPPAPTSEPTHPKKSPFLQGLLPIDRSRIRVEVVAGITLAALAIPEVMGYTAIAGMPVITGLYTILLPILVFAVLGSSRHLVVGADSATAAVMASGLAIIATVGSSQYVALAGLLALMVAVLLFIARAVGLGFLADFLSRTVLVGFLTGVGIQVACGQLGGLLGIKEGTGVPFLGMTLHGTIGKAVSTLENISDISWQTVAVSAAVLVVLLGSKYVTRTIPGALIAVLGSIALSWQLDFSAHDIATVGHVPGGLPHLAFPDVGASDVVPLLAMAVSITVLILAQSAATSRAYAAKYDEPFSENVDLVGLGAANVAAGFTGAFVVNGSPTKTQMVDGAGGKTQLAQLTTGLIVLIVLLFLTAPLQYLPNAVLAAVVFLIGIELIDLKTMKTIWRLRRDEFAVALSTAAVVVIFGVEEGIIWAIVVSIIDHLRRSYRPPTAVLQQLGGDGAWRSVPANPTTRSAPGLVVYRFAASLYYANASHFSQEIHEFVESSATDPIEWFALDAGVIPDIDYSAAQALKQIATELKGQGIKLVIVQPLKNVEAQLHRYGIVDVIGEDAIFVTVVEAAAAFRARAPHA